MKTIQNSKTLRDLWIGSVIVFASFLQEGLGQSEKASGTLKPTEIIKKLDPHLIVPVFGSRSDEIRSENAKVRQRVAEWQKSIEDKTASEGIYVGDGSFGLLWIDTVTKALGKPEKETKQLLTPMTTLKGVGLLIRDGGKVKPILPSDPNNAKYLVGRVLWYGPIGLGFLESGTTTLESLEVMLCSNVPASRTSKADPNSELKKDRDARTSSNKWPKLDAELRGTNEVRVKNPNDFTVKVGLRNGTKGRDFSVAAQDSKSVHVPEGRYDIFFEYSSDPGGLYQGDSFTLSNSGVEIQIVKVTTGNYQIRKVR